MVGGGGARFPAPSSRWPLIVPSSAAAACWRGSLVLVLRCRFKSIRQQYFFFCKFCNSVTALRVSQLWSSTLRQNVQIVVSLMTSKHGLPWANTKETAGTWLQLCQKSAFYFIIIIFLHEQITCRTRPGDRKGFRGWQEGLGLRITVGLHGWHKSGFSSKSRVSASNAQFRLFVNIKFLTLLSCLKRFFFLFEKFCCRKSDVMSSLYASYCCARVVRCPSRQQ